MDLKKEAQVMLNDLLNKEEGITQTDLDYVEWISKEPTWSRIQMNEIERLWNKYF